MVGLEEFAAANYIISSVFAALEYSKDPNMPYCDQGLNTAKLTFYHANCEVWKTLMCNMEKD